MYINFRVYIIITDKSMKNILASKLCIIGYEMTSKNTISNKNITGNIYILLTNKHNPIIIIETLNIKVQFGSVTYKDKLFFVCPLITNNKKGSIKAVILPKIVQNILMKIGSLLVFIYQ